MILSRIQWSSYIGVFILCCTFLACDSVKTQRRKNIQIKIGRYSLRVEVAANRQDREQGLMYRSQLKEGHGMLFVFPYPQKVTFWMKNTLIPLDIGYFNPQARLTEYMSMEPDQNDGKLYASSDLVLYAVETNRGWFKKRQILKNARLKLPYLITGY